MLNVDERKTMLTLWAMARSPLMFGGDLPSSAPSTLAMLENPALLDATAHTCNNAELIRETIPGTDGEAIAWAAETTQESTHPHSYYVALFWTGDMPQRLDVELKGLIGLGRDPSAFTLNDMWAHAGCRAADATVSADGLLHAVVPGHGVVWLTVKPKR
jgi:hypothetical protein